MPKRASVLDILPLHQAILPEKLKLTEFAGDPLELAELSSLFIAVIHNALIGDDAKMEHSKTLVKGKANAAVAGLEYSGALNHTVWDTLDRNFGSVDPRQ